MITKNGIIFRDTDFEAIVRDFAETAPQLLLQHPETAKIALEIDRQKLAEQLGTQFTVAVIGQMKAGKSTLLNAIIGKDLAPTGVSESTATVNHFRYDAEGDLSDKFRVHWEDGRTENRALDELNAWTGTEENAKKTKFLDFFAGSDFLKTAIITDTPGTRSVEDSHEQAAQGIISDKLESETFLYGERAHAVIYVVNPVARREDKDLLRVFGAARRLPGASPANSIAVVQKWELMPLGEADRKCERLYNQLREEVCEVFPASGLLANALRVMPEDSWNLLAKFAVESTPEAFMHMLRMDRYFLRDDSKTSGASLDLATRNRLYESIVASLRPPTGQMGSTPSLPADVKKLESEAKARSWSVIRFSLLLANSKKLDDGKALQDAVLEASGIEKLKTVLQKRFFTPHRLIRTTNVLSKVSEPCDTALVKLENIEEDKRDNLDLGEQSRKLLKHSSDVPDIILKPVQGYIDKSISSVKNEMEQVQRLQLELGRTQRIAKRNAEQIDDEIKYLGELDKCLSQLDETFRPDGEKRMLERLFGVNGTSVWERLGLASESELGPATQRYAFKLRVHWSNRYYNGATGIFRRVCDCAVNRLDSILDYLEENVNE